MDFIEDPQPGNGELAFEYALSVLDHIPAKITPRCSGQASGKGRLSDLTGPYDKDHFAGEITAHLSVKVATAHGHNGDYTVVFDHWQNYSR